MVVSGLGLCRSIAIAAEVQTPAPSLEASAPTGLPITLLDDSAFGLAAVPDVSGRVQAGNGPRVTEASVNDGPSAEAELRATMTELHKAALEGDSEKTASLMTDGYVQTDITGHFQEKTEWLDTYSKPLAELIKAGKFHWEVYDENDVQIRMYKDAAVVMGRLELKWVGGRWEAPHTLVADPGAHFSATLRSTRVFIRRNGKWLLAAIHNALPLPPPANK
jgi:hypothetical protein